MGKKEISIDVVYHNEFKKIIGKKSERIRISFGSTSLDFINLLLKKYPRIKKVPPTRLGFERNGQIPKASQILENGDRYEFVVHNNDGGYGQMKFEEIDNLFKEAKKTLGSRASREELVDFVSEMMPRKKFDGLSDFDMKVLQTVADAGENGFPIMSGSDEEVMTWLDCVWKRISCGKDSCPICGRINQDKKRLAREGKNPDSIQTAFDSLGANLAETMALIQKDAKAMGIDVSNLKDVADAPEAESFPLAVRAEKWYSSIMDLYKKEEIRGAAWLLTEEALDLNWYAGIFNAKVYRQLCNKWYFDNEKNYGDFDYIYTSRVIKEVGGIVSGAFEKLLPMASDFKSLYADFYLINKEIKKL